MRTSVFGQAAIVLIIAGSFLPLAYRFIRHPQFLDGVSLVVAIGMGALFALRLIPEQVLLCLFSLKSMCFDTSD